MSAVADRHGIVGLGEPVSLSHDHHQARRLRRTIVLLAIVNAIVFASYAVISWGSARLTPFGTVEPIEAAFFDRLARSLAFVGGNVAALLRGQTALADAPVFFAVFSLLYVVPAVTFVMLLAALARDRAAVSDATVRAVFRCAVLFAAVAALSYPVLVQDFWLSAGWGRLIADGVNPYYVNLTPETTRGLPLDYLGLLMTYGPLWALISGVVMAVAGTHVLLTFALFKLVLLAAWIASLALVRHLLRDRPPVVRCTALAIAGWLPLGVTQIVAEGHNDIVMAFFLLAWLALLEDGRPLRATGALAVSVLTKYVSAPVFLLDLLHLWRSRRRSLLAYLPHAALAAIMAVVVFAFFFRSPAFFESTRHMAGWHFFTPRDAIVGVARVIGIEPSLGTAAGIIAALLAIGVQAFFLLIPVLGLFRYLINPNAATFRFALLTFTTGIFFGVIGHLWPWFLVTGLLVAALHPSSVLTRWTVGVALALPLPLVFWVTYPSDDVLARITPPLYLFAVLWYTFAPHRWLEVEPRGPARRDRAPIIGT